MANPYFGREGRMGMGTVFRNDGREGRPSEKNGRYPSLVALDHLFMLTSFFMYRAEQNNIG